MFRLSILLLTVLLGCEKKAPVYDILEIKEMILQRDPSAKEVVLRTEEKRVPCSLYGEHCVEASGKRFEIRGIEMITIAFKDQESAFKEAQLLGQYYARNWVFDDVTNEPILENFVKEVFNARRPSPIETSHPKDHVFVGGSKSE
jgi:hypothetical protein